MIITNLGSAWTEKNKLKANKTFTLNEQYTSASCNDLTKGYIILAQLALHTLSPHQTVG